LILKSPGFAYILKSKVTLVLEKVIRYEDRVIHVDHFLEATLKHVLRRPVLVAVLVDERSQVVLDITIKDIAPVAVGHKNIAVAVIVEIGHEYRPTPFRLGHPGEL